MFAPMLKQNIDKIDWYNFSYNPSIFEKVEEEEEKEEKEVDEEVDEEYEDEEYEDEVKLCEKLHEVCLMLQQELNTTKFLN